jgi:UPF0755 protein
MSNKSSGGHNIQPKSPKAALQPEQVPAPPPPSKRSRHPVVVFFNGILTFLVLFVVALGAILYVGKLQFDAPGPLAQDETILISRGMDTDTIASVLERNNIIENKWLFLGGVYLYRANRELKAGEYLFEKNASMKEVMDTIVDGKSILYSITIPEGWTSQQIVNRLRESEALTGDIAEIPEEGTLLPETYKFTRGTTRQQALNKMKEAQDRALASIWERRIEGLPVESPEELVILASIVEKETGRADERTRVAGVFINRLNRNMRLQSDPTILYGLYRSEAWERPRVILRSELDAPNDYNTYQIDGLPPGPIANPGRAAMEAVANPSRTDDLFFVADGTGGHVFAETYAEHNRNVQRWRQIEQQRREEQQASPSSEAESSETTEQPSAEPTQQ